jgi:hypothetical protein
MSKTIAEWQGAVWSTAEEHGWHEGTLDTNAVAAKLALIHSETSEALEELRNGRLKSWEGENGKPEGFPVELADIVIRCLDLAGQLGFVLEDEIAKKHAYNESRPYRHGNKAL